MVRKECDQLQINSFAVAVFTVSCPRRTENGERRTENGERRTENGERRTENDQRSTAFPHLHQKYVIDSSLDTHYSRLCIFSSLSDFVAPKSCRNCKPENQVSGESRKPRTQPESELYGSLRSVPKGNRPGGMLGLKGVQYKILRYPLDTHNEWAYFSHPKVVLREQPNEPDHPLTRR